jgi:hypothetical protein
MNCRLLRRTIWPVEYLPHFTGFFVRAQEALAEKFQRHLGKQKRAEHNAANSFAVLPRRHSVEAGLPSPGMNLADRFAIAWNT